MGREKEGEESNVGDGGVLRGTWKKNKEAGSSFFEARTCCASAIQGCRPRASRASGIVEAQIAPQEQDSSRGSSRKQRRASVMCLNHDVCTHELNVCT